MFILVRACKVIMKNSHYLDNMSISEAIVEFCTIPRSRDELTAFVDKSKNYVMSQIVQPLLDSKKLKLTISDKPKSAYQRFVKRKNRLKKR